MEILELELQTHRIVELKEFYTERLGLPLKDQGARSFTVTAGKTRLRFTEADKVAEPFYHFAFNIPENKVEEAREWLSERVELLQHEGDEVIHFVHWNAHSLYFQDPAGNIVEFIGRHYLANATTVPFSQQDILCVSEIGLPVDDVLRTLDNLKVTLALESWREPSSTFAPVGDEHGLFILVAKGRTWFMSDKAAKAFPATITIRGARNLQVRLQNYQIRYTDGRG